MTNQSKRRSRRRFLATLGKSLPVALGFPQIVAAATLGRSGAVAPSSRIQLGFIGLGRHGRGVNLRTMAGFKDCRVAALCDVDRRQFPEAIQVLQQSGENGFSENDCTQDWREVVSRPDIDAVVISTPDHWHIPLSLAAIQAGKDVLCEKTSHTIAEGRQLADTVDRTGAVFQIAMEDRALPEYRRIAEIVRNGGVGALRRVEITLPANPKRQVPLREDPVPEELDWEMWRGSAPEAPFQEERIMAEYGSGIGWRNISDYGGGMLNDWGVHLGDTAIWAMGGLGSKRFTVSAKHEYFEKGLLDLPYFMDVRYQFETGPEVSFKTGGTGLRFVGDEGWVAVDAWRKPLTASSQAILDRVYGEPDLRLPVYPREHRDFIDGVRRRQGTMYDAEYYHRISTMLLCGNLAGRLGRELRWDPAAEAFIDDAEANRLRGSAASKPWDRT